jgi:hypothetical protein
MSAIGKPRSRGLGSGPGGRPTGLAFRLSAGPGKRSRKACGTILQDAYYFLDDASWGGGSPCT